MGTAEVPGTREGGGGDAPGSPRCLDARVLGVAAPGPDGPRAGRAWEQEGARSRARAARPAASGSRPEKAGSDPSGSGSVGRRGRTCSPGRGPPGALGLGCRAPGRAGGHAAEGQPPEHIPAYRPTVRPGNPLISGPHLSQGSVFSSPSL